MSSKPGLQEQSLLQTGRSGEQLSEMLNVFNNNSKDLAKLTLNLYRLVLVPMTRIVDYAFRNINMFVTMYTKRLGNLLIDTFYTTPQIDALLERDLLDRQAHLTALDKANVGDYVPLQRSGYPSVVERLTKKAFFSDAGDLRAVGDILLEEGKTVQLGNRVGKEPVLPNDPLRKHLNYLLDHPRVLTEAALYYDYGTQYRLPHMPDASKEETQQAVHTIKGMLKHLNNTGLTNFLVGGRQLFQDMANGRYSSRSSGFVDHKGILQEIDALSSRNGPHGDLGDQLIRTLIGFVEFDGKKVRKKIHAQLAKEHLQQDIRRHQPMQQRLQEFMIEAFQGKVTLPAEGWDGFWGKVPEEEVFRFGKATEKLGLTPENSQQVSQALAQGIEHLVDLMQEAREQVAAAKDPAQLERLGHSLKTRLNEGLLKLAAAYPTDTAKPVQTLLQAGPDSPLFRQMEDALKSETVRKVISNVVGSIQWPSIAFSTISGVVFSGIMMSYIDNAFVQPYQRNVVAQKGDVKEAMPAFAGGTVVGLAVGQALNRWPFIHRLTQNEELPRFLITGTSAMVAGGAAMYGLWKLMLMRKPDLPPSPEERNRVPHAQLGVIWRSPYHSNPGNNVQTPSSLTRQDGLDTKVNTPAAAQPLHSPLPPQTVSSQTWFSASPVAGPPYAALQGGTAPGMPLRPMPLSNVATRPSQPGVPVRPVLPQASASSGLWT